jgi:diadenylate cyclase
MNLWAFGSNLLEICIIALSNYYIYLKFRGTRGAKVLTGLVLLFSGLIILANVLGLRQINLLLQVLIGYITIALIIIFQPELRRALAEIGSTFILPSANRGTFIIENIVQSLVYLKEKGLGALISIDMNAPSHQIRDTGVAVNAEVSNELLSTIFTPPSPLHDGGVVIERDRIVAAGCIFPVTQRQDLSRSLGLRHRAALGLSEESDSLIIILSEETGTLSLCEEGSLRRPLEIDELRSILSERLLPKKVQESSSQSTFFGRFQQYFEIFFKRNSNPGQSFMWDIKAKVVCLVLAFIIWLAFRDKAGEHLSLVETWFRH